MKNSDLNALQYWMQHRDEFLREFAEHYHCDRDGKTIEALRPAIVEAVESIAEDYRLCVIILTLQSIVDEIGSHLIKKDHTIN